MLACAGAIAALVGCLAPTETTLILSTDVDCGARKPSTAIYTGAVHDTDPSSPRTITQECAANGRIGTLVVVPGDTGEFQVDVVTALDGTDPTTCASHPERCITSRRRVTSLAHTPLTLPIANDMDCLGISCNPASTCYRGRCVDATMDPGACSSPEGCVPSAVGGVPGTRPPGGDAAGSVASADGPGSLPPPPPGVAPSDGGDAGTSTDGGTDATGSGDAGPSDAGTLPDGAVVDDSGTALDGAIGPDGGVILEAGAGKDGAVVIGPDGSLG